jgi:uncharacterized protein YndB with AHSA1/START domain
VAAALARRTGESYRRLAFSVIEENDTGINSSPARDPRIEVDAMSDVVEGSIDIDRTPEEVFEYATDASLLPTWQRDVEAAQADPPAVRAVGMRGREVRRTPAGRRTVRWEVTECERGRRWSVRGVEGPLRARVTMTFTPTDVGAGTRFRYGIAFEGRGIGRALGLLARRGAEQGLPTSLALLKRRVEELDVGFARDPGVR